MAQFVFLLLFSASWVSCQNYLYTDQSANATRPTTTINSGRIRGRAVSVLQDNATVNQFLGIPFAQPPVNELRFAPPKPLEPWTGTYDATSQPKACMQYTGSREEGGEDAWLTTVLNEYNMQEDDEDCLYLNVYAPSGGEPNKPVLFWIYGGSGFAGAVSDPTYDGTSFAANHDIVVVAANYRVNVFGTPRAPQIPLTERNLGLWDQRLALNWTQQNIHAFGGDPKMVTIMGESAGAMGVGHHINTMPDDPPFHAAVQMSGSSIASAPDVGESSPDEAWAVLLEHLNCTRSSDQEVLACVRAVPARTIQRILNEQEITSNAVSQDNVTVLERPDVAWAAGNVAKVPLLIGSTKDDGSIFVRDWALQADALNIDIRTLLEELQVPDEQAELIIQLYGPESPYGNFSGAGDVLNAYATDATFRCTSGFVANLTSTVLQVPVWQYVFDALVPSNTWEEYPDLGVYHGSELPLLFGTYNRANSTELEAKLSRSMQKQFADFVKDPETGPGWAEYPEVAVLAFENGAVSTATEDVRVLDSICQTYNGVFAAQLPALAKTNLRSENDANSRSPANEVGEPNSSDKLRLNSVILIGAGILSLAVFL